MVRAGHDYPIDVKLGAPISAVASNDVPPAIDLAPHSVASDVAGPTTVTASSGDGAFYTAWWFWAGVGAVVVGAVLATVFGIRAYNNSAPTIVHHVQADYPCNPMCAGWLNKPPAIVPYPMGP
jgi:hypothetical protein